MPIFTSAAASLALATFIASPAQARFLQTDPIGYEDQINLYAYVGNDPINGIDPTGECGADAEGNEVGVCATTTQAANIFEAQRTNPNSIASEVEISAVAAGVKIDFSVDPNNGGDSSFYSDSDAELDVTGELSVGLREHTVIGTKVDGGQKDLFLFQRTKSLKMS